MNWQLNLYYKIYYFQIVTNSEENSGIGFMGLIIYSECLPVEFKVWKNMWCAKFLIVEYIYAI